MALLPVPFGNPYTYTGHSGVDFPQMRGIPFRASGPGVVSSIDYSPRAGHTVWVRYDNGPNVGYAHMDSRTTAVRVSQRVTEGTVLGRVGSLGLASTGPHLHVEVAGHATTAGFWKFFDRNRVVGQGQPAGSGDKPFTPPITKEWDEMATKAEIKQVVLEALGSRPDTVLIHYGVGTRNGIVLAAPGFWHKFTGEQWTQFNAHGLRSGIREITPVNDRDYDVFKEIYSPAPVGISAEQLKAIADATAKQIDVGDVVVDYDKIAVDVRNKFRAEPLK